MWENVYSSNYKRTTTNDSMQKGFACIYIKVLRCVARLLMYLPDEPLTCDPLAISSDSYSGASQAQLTV